MMKKSLVLAALVLSVSAGERKAKNVIVFLGDAGGIPTLHAASIHGYGAPGKLFIQTLPNMGLSETSPVGGWVTDSVAEAKEVVALFEERLIRSRWWSRRSKSANCQTERGRGPSDGRGYAIAWQRGSTGYVLAPGLHRLREGDRRDPGVPIPSGKAWCSEVRMADVPREKLWWI